MKPRPPYFLSEENIDHDSEIFDYIRELHDYLWAFVRTQMPGTSGDLKDYVDEALKIAKQRSKLKEKYIERMKTKLRCKRCNGVGSISRTIITDEDTHEIIAIEHRCQCGNSFVFNLKASEKKETQRSSQYFEVIE